jgi:hypothetical protein
MPMFDPIVLDSRQTLMQRIADYVRTGHVHWTSGEVSLERAPAMARKFARLYAVDRDRNRRFRAKRDGEANAVLLLHRGPECSAISWFLLCTDGEQLVHQLERLRDATTKTGRVRLGDYELVQLTKRARPRRSPSALGADSVPARVLSGHGSSTLVGGSTVLTWRMHDDTYEAYRERALQVTRGDNPAALLTFITDIYRAPGFYGVRHQVGKVISLARREYRRVHGSLTRFPMLPRLYFVTRRANRGMRLSRIAASVGAQGSGVQEPPCR